IGGRREGPELLDKFRCSVGRTEKVRKNAEAPGPFDFERGAAIRGLLHRTSLQCYGVISPLLATPDGKFSSYPEPPSGPRMMDRAYHSPVQASSSRHVFSSATMWSR